MDGADGNVGARAYQDLVERANLDRDVLGLILGGGRGKGVYSDRSDYDAYVVFRDPAMGSAASLVPDSPMLEVVPTSLEELESIAAEWTHPLRWNRYTFAHVSPVVDKTDGCLQPVLDLMEVVPQDHVEPHLRESLDAYVNSTYRSLKNARDGERAGALLDAAESVPPLLDFLFGIDGRVRPYNKFLSWELDHHAVPDVDLPTAELASMIQRVGRGDAESQRGTFRWVEAMSTRRGLGDVIDAWGGRSLTVLRG